MIKKTFIAFMLIALFSCSKEDDIKIPYPDIEEYIFNAINEHRDTIGLDMLILDPNISNMAREHSVSMASIDVLSHDGFFEERNPALKELNYIATAENVAYSTIYTNIPENWLESTGHKKNIEADYTHTGIGVAFSGKNRYYVTQLFAK